MADLAFHFRRFAETTTSPLYAQLSTTAAEHVEIVELLGAAPETQRIPVLLFAAIHDILLSEPEQPLAEWYPSIVSQPRTDDSGGEFVQFCATHAAEIRAIVADRSTQTNEIGRCAFFVPALAAVANEVGSLSILDVGASGGLNLLLDRYDYRYDPGGELTSGSTVMLEAGTRGEVPVPGVHPPIVDRIGLDRSPVDVTDPRQARWLEACVWPDQTHRFERLAAAIELAKADPPTVIAGDAVDDLAAMVDRLEERGHPVVMNSWVLNYLSRDRRDRYVAELDRVGARRDLTWVFAESPHVTEGLPYPDGRTGSELTELVVVRWRSGSRSLDHLATVHPHGRWMHWHPD